MCVRAERAGGVGSGGWTGGQHLGRAPGHLLSASLLTGRSFRLSDLPAGGELVGSSNGWIAFLLFPLKDTDDGPVVKVAFAVNPTVDDYTAVAICGDRRRLAYAKAKDMQQWTVMDVAMADERDRLVDLVYDAGGGKVYCVTPHGDVHVFHVVPGCRRRRPSLARGGGLFAPPYDVASKLTGAKNIFVSGGSLYQVWRNTTCAAVSRMMMPGGGGGGGQRFAMAKDEVFVLKYDPSKRRGPYLILRW
nr:unnamed protein product [Digitaria exilis]